MMSELNDVNQDYHTSVRTEYVKDTFGVKGEHVIGPVKSRKRFFKSSRKRQIMVKEIVTQVGS